MKIVTDCAADLENEEREALDIVQAPLYIQFPEGEVNSADITPDEFYDRLEAMRPNIPTTAQPSTGVFTDIYNKLAETSKDILSIHISSGLSGTINSARLGAEHVKKSVVNVLDTLTLSGGQRFQVLAAALARGGRIGRVQALMGSVLKIKPIIRVDHADGKYSTVGKGRTIPQAISNISDHLVEMYGSIPLWVTVLHGRFADGADTLTEVLKERLNIQKLEVLRISPVLGVHTGPGIVGAAVLPYELVEDLMD